LVGFVDLISKFLVLKDFGLVQLVKQVDPALIFIYLGLLIIDELARHTNLKGIVIRNVAAERSL
jgi:hypothetical protein